MSAITGIGDSVTTVFSASTSWSRGTATRTKSAPASATLWICSIVGSRLAVSVLVIVCTATGAPPPIGTPPTHIWRFEAMSLKGSGPAKRRSVRVQRFDLVRVLVGDRLALQLHRRRQLVSPRLPRL